MPTILIKKSDTPGAAPATANLTNAAGGAEIAVNTADKRLFSITSASAIIELGTNPQSITVTSGAVLNGGVVINELGADVDLRVESDTNVNAFFVDGANGNVGIGTDSPGALLDVRGSAIFNEGGADVDFRVEGDTDANLFFVDASTDRIGVGTDTPAAKFDLNGASILRGNVLTTGAFIPGANVSAPTADAFIIRSADNTMQLGTASTARLTIDSSGNLGLGAAVQGSWGSGSTALQLGKSTTDKGSISTEEISGDDYLSVSRYCYFDNTDWKRIGGGNPTRYYQRNGTHGWQTAASGADNSTITWTDAALLDASGNLVVGGTTANGKLDVYGILAVSNSAGNYWAFDRDDANGGLKISDGTTERARITAGGNLLVGTTSSSAAADPGVKIIPEFNGANAPGLAIVTSLSADTSASLSLYSTGAGAYRFYVADGGTIYATNTSITAISDQRYKENIRDLDVGLDAVMALKPRKFDWKEGKGADIKDARGFIAQEFEQVFPDLVTEWLDPAPEGEEPYKAVRQDLIPVLVKAIQEQQAMIEDLKAKVAALEAK